MTERTNYLAIASDWDKARNWCSLYGVNPMTVRYITSMGDMRGIGDFSLIVFSGWTANLTSGYTQIVDYAMFKAKQMYFPDTHKPVVNRRGVIERWERIG